MEDIFELLRSLPYPGRGLFAGRTEDGKSAVLFYFLTGRSVNSRNRIFVPDGDGIRTEAFDPSKVTDPSLIIYSPVKVFENKTIVTNGDQTDTVYDGFLKGKTFAQSITNRTFEPDAPNYTPRISAVLTAEDGNMEYTMSMIRTTGGDPEKPSHELFKYLEPQAGEGHFLRTYEGGGDPIPSFEGAPVKCSTADWGNDPDEIAHKIWDAMDEDNKVSLFVRVIDLEDMTFGDCIINKLKGNRRLA